MLRQPLVHLVQLACGVRFERPHLVRVLRAQRLEGGLLARLRFAKLVFRFPERGGQRLLRLALRLIARLGERGVAVAPGLLEVRAASLFGLVNLTRVLRALVGEHLIELGSKCRQLRVADGHVFRVARPKLGELPFLGLGVGANPVDPRAALLADSLGEIAIGGEDLGVLLRLGERALHAQETVVEVGLGPLEGELLLLQLHALAVLSRQLLLESENLLVLAIERLAKIEELAARDAAGLRAGQDLRAELVHLGGQPFGLARLEAELVDLPWASRSDPSTSAVRSRARTSSSRRRS